jgi:hypothetical protein
MNPHATRETQPTRAELMARLITCAAVLDIRAAEAVGEYRPYFADRAWQCRKWIADLREGHRQDEDIAEGMAEFEALAL